MKYTLSVPLILIWLLTACSTADPLAVSSPSASVESIQPTAVRSTAESPTETAALTTTEDTRLLPEDWQNWPVIPELTVTARVIYEQGLQMGNDLHAFSKIGDCQNLKTVFLWKFDHLDIYEFEWDITPYLDTITNFQGYFDRDGQSAQYGFTAASPLTQIQADPENCRPDETPMECELRITRPTFVLVSLAFPFNLMGAPRVCMNSTCAASLNTAWLRAQCPFWRPRLITSKRIIPLT